MSGRWIEDNPELRKAETGEELIGPWGKAPPVAKAHPPGKVQLVVDGRVIDCGEGMDPEALGKPEGLGKP